jgi:hypothetical protein
MRSSKTTSQLQLALSAFQSTLTPVTPIRTNAFFDSKFAGLSDVFDHVTEDLSAHGLAIIQGGKADHTPCLVTRLCHSSGEWIEDEGYPLIPSPDKKGQISMQAQMSAVTYARRYGLMSMLGITIAGEDDDGAAASQTNGQTASKTKLAPRNGIAAPKTPALSGPIKTITKLKDIGREMATDIAACDDVDQLSAFRTCAETQTYLKQLKVDWPDAYDHPRDDKNDFVGMKQRFEEKAAALGPQDA